MLGIRQQRNPATNKSTGWTATLFLRRKMKRQKTATSTKAELTVIIIYTVKKNRKNPATRSGL